jgi:hypothetical protein
MSIGNRREAELITIPSAFAQAMPHSPIAFSKWLWRLAAVRIRRHGSANIPR